MKLLELFENVNSMYATDIHKFDSYWNPELDGYAQEERSRTSHLKKEANGGTPLIVTDANQQDAWCTSPNKHSQQSPGYRGRERAKERAGIPHKKYNSFNPHQMSPNAEFGVETFPQGTRR